MLKNQMRILICRPDRLGDVVLSTPISREIKKRFPDSYIVMLVRNYTKDVFLNNPNIDEIILLEETEGEIEFSWNKIKEIKSHNFTHAFMLLPNERINYMLFLAGIRNRYGSGHKLYQFITLTHAISRKKYTDERHEADYCMDFARRIGIKTEDISSVIYLNEDEKEIVKQKRINLKREKKFLIGIQTSSGNSAPNWKIDEYYKLIKLLAEDDRYSVVITDPVKNEDLLGLKEISYPNIGNKLRESILNFATLDLLISASTGPMHICAALQVPTLSLFCPLPACMPKLWGPRGNIGKAIMPDKQYCENHCPDDPKKCSLNDASNGISAEKVLNEVNHLLEELEQS